jgi:hypothetical protein
VRSLPFLLAALFPIASFAQDAKSLVPDALQQGTMTNEKLRQDALVGVHGWLGAKGCENLLEFTPFVTRLPEGEVGSRAWQEAWVAGCSNGKFTVRIDFVESGLNAANWTIRETTGH